MSFAKSPDDLPPDFGEGFRDFVRERINTLEAALREARGMLKSCGFEHPEDDPELVASWERGLEKIDAALAGGL